MWGEALSMKCEQYTPCENKTPTGKGEMGRIGSTWLFGRLSLSCLSSIFARGMGWSLVQMCLTQE